MVVVATLFEPGPYEAGVAALLNSLLAAGYRGHVWCGIRGDAPTWLQPSAVERCAGDAITIKTMAIATPTHLTMHKPHFMSAVAQHEPTATGLVYLDPDIVVKCDWTFVDRWCAGGIAAVADANWWMPASSPVRRDWDSLRRTLGLGDPSPERSAGLDFYCNAGFVGVSADCRPFWQAWQTLIDQAVAMDGAFTEQIAQGRNMGIWHLDQDLLNMVLMDWAHKAHLMGPEAMDFAPGGGVLSHATGTPKPWQRHFLRQALIGRPPSKTDREYLRYAEGPFRVPGAVSIRRKLACYKAARAVGMVARRADY